MKEGDTMAHRSTRLLGPAVFVVVLTAFAGGGAGDARAASDAAAEFDRITADMRAAVARHDARAFHAFHAQLVELIRAVTDR